MPELKRLIERLLFSSIPSDWSVCAVSVDWQGEPLVLLQEGKPRRPGRDADRAYHKPYLTVRSHNSADVIVWELVTPEGRHLSKLAGGPRETTTRGWHVPFQCCS